MMRVDAFPTNCRLADGRLVDGRLVDIRIAGGKIAAVGEGAASLSNTAPALDMRGDLVLPGLVDGHRHLDKPDPLVLCYCMLPVGRHRARNVQAVTISCCAHR
jgi:N-acyl-D-aspartate/D-glutamate deacylase